MNIITWLNAYSGVLMLLVTVIYVIATIFIYKANNEAAKMAKVQLIEMREQYDDEKRMKIMPYFIVRVLEKSCYVDGIDKCYISDVKKYENISYLSATVYFEIQNLGHDIAKECKYYWINSVLPAIRKYTIVSIAIGEKRILKVDFYAEACDDYLFTTIKCGITYKDLLDNEYEQICNINFEVSKSRIKYISHSMTAPVWLNN